MNSILVAFAVTIAVTLDLGFGYAPTVAFAMVGTGIVIVLVAIYILMNAACIGFFARRGGGFNVLSHLVIPLLGIAAFSIVLRLYIRPNTRIHLQIPINFR